MNDYKILQQKTFESMQKFENRCNELCKKGWKAISIGGSHQMAVLLEKTKEY